jgi:uncharacterized membrane protein YqiK
MDPQTISIIWGIGGLVVFFVIVGFLKSLIRVCPSNTVLVISGFEHTVGGKKYGFRIVRGGWTFVVPFFERVEALDLTILPINVRVEGVNSANGITVGADASSCVCVDDSDPALLFNAVERLLGKSRAEIQEQIQMTMVGNFRGALNRTTPLQAIGMTEEVDLEETGAGVPIEPVTEGGAKRSNFRELLLKDCSEDLSSFGVKVVSVSLQRIWDTSQYIANLANKTLSLKRRDVEIEEARLKAMVERTESDSERRIEVATNAADEKILGARQKLEVYRQQCDAAIQQASLEADSTIAAASNEGQRHVQEVAVKLQELKNRSDVVLMSEVQRTKAETLAQGVAKATEIVQGTRNELLQQRARLLSEGGDVGKITLFMSQLPHLFSAFQEHAKGLTVDSLLVMGEDSGFNEAVNRGPRALVDFLGYFQKAFGINVRDFVTAESVSDSTPQGREEGAR